jgi:hypothetical protein
METPIRFSTMTRRRVHKGNLIPFTIIDAISTPDLDPWHLMRLLFSHGIAGLLG